MLDSVRIKGCQNGLIIIASEEATIYEVLDKLKYGLKKNIRSTNSKSINLIMEGKVFNPQEIDILKKELEKVGIKPNIDKCNIKNEYDNLKFLPVDEGLFFIGDVKRGQIIEAVTSIVIVGNVEPGAIVYSNANVVVVGKQTGIVYAGVSGNLNALVYSLDSGRNS